MPSDQWRTRGSMRGCFCCSGKESRASARADRSAGFGEKTSWSSSLHPITPSKAAGRWIARAFFARMTQKLGCAFQNPAAFSFFILSRFSISDEWTYRSSVMVVVACPSTSESDLISNPTSTARVANVCRSV